MDLNQIVVFARVVQAGSFSAAARLLDLPKSTVSRKVSDLEDRIGARLIHRTTRKLGLTDAGRIYYEHAARIVAEVEEADQAVGRMQATPRGLLKVTAPLAFDMLGPIVTEYLGRYGDVSVELTCTDRAVDLVEEGYDVAIRAGALGDSSLVARRLGTLQRLLVASPRYCKEHGTPRAPADLPQHSCISFGAGATPNLWVLFAGSERAEVHVTPRLTVNDFDIMRAAARGGLGVAAMPAFVAEDDLAHKRLRRVLPEWASQATPVHALYPTARHLSPKVATFIALMADKLRL